MKKVKVILSFILALCMVFTLASCGGEKDKTDDNKKPSTTASAETTTKAPEEMTMADVIALINAETAKASKGDYTLERRCAYTEGGNPTVGEYTDLINSVIPMFGGYRDLDHVVADFIGLEDIDATVVGGKSTTNIKENYLMKATVFTEADVEKYVANGNKHTFKIVNCTNPERDEKNAMSRVTNDILTKQDVSDKIKSEGVDNIAKVGETSIVNYKEIWIEAEIVDGKITSLKVTYTFDATLDLKLDMSSYYIGKYDVQGKGEAMTTIVYSDVKY